MNSKIKTFLFWFAAEFWIYALIVANGRAYVQGNYLWTILTYMTISFNTFYFSVKFIENKDNREWPAMLGCVLGGGTGSCCAIFLTKMVYGQ